MAIISIPSSIGGVSIPGAVLKGPLAKLFNSGSSIATYSYPRDLGSATRGHYIIFDIEEIIPTKYSSDETLGFLTNAYNDSKADIAGAPQSSGFVETASTVVTTTAAVAKNVVYGAAGATWSAAKELAKTTKLQLEPEKTKITSLISLYMPDAVSFTNQASYGKISLVEIAKEATDVVKSLGKVGNIIGSIAGAPISLATSQAGKLALSTQGLALNPKEQMLFDGIDFRSYSLSFTFTPYSKEEADSVKNIIKQFKKHAAPRISDSGMFFIPPSRFNLSFYKDGAINDNISKVAKSVIESIEVNYAPNGYVTHTDGAPVQTTLTLNFKEIELIDREKIEFDGY
jgi:hypothetical protein